MLNRSEMLENVRAACAENIPRGIEFAWCDQSGRNVRWSDILELLESFNGCCEIEKLVDPIHGTRSNGIIYDEYSVDDTSEGTC